MGIVRILREECAMRILYWKRAILLAALALLASLVIACGGDSATDAEKDMQEGE